MQSTNIFQARLERLRTALDVREDQEVATVLGMTKAALSARKSRNSFPEKELRALVQQRPDLDIDVEYVLTGATLSAHQRQTQQAARQATLDAAGIDEATRARMLAQLDQIDLEMATTNARRDADYRQITEMLRLCSDETVALASKLVAKLFRADVAERKPRE